eukprot:scaffold140942_cov30-Tisochrysis_lutea.AAC.3
MPPPDLASCAPSFATVRSVAQMPKRCDQHQDTERRGAVPPKHQLVVGEAIAWTALRQEHGQMASLAGSCRAIPHLPFRRRRDGHTVTPMRDP